jgi:hypothetical protein
VKTDADGKFKMELPSSISQIIIVAKATRQVLDRRENYFWAVKVKPPASVTLSNDNLAEAASSESVLQTLALTAPANPEDTADVLEADLQKLKPNFEKLVHDFEVNTGRSVDLPAAAPMQALMIALPNPAASRCRLEQSSNLFPKLTPKCTSII